MKYLKNEKGQALILTIILLAIVTILGTAVLTTLVAEIRINKRIEERSIATYLAESGIEHGLKILEETPIGEIPVVPREHFVVYHTGDRTHDYQILQLTDSLLQSVGRIKVNESIIRTVTINVHIHEGEITAIDVE